MVCVLTPLLKESVTPSTPPSCSHNWKSKLKKLNSEFIAGVTSSDVSLTLVFWLQAGTFYRMTHSSPPASWFQFCFFYVYSPGWPQTPYAAEKGLGAKGKAWTIIPNFLMVYTN